MSRTALVWDRDTNERLQSEHDVLNIDDQKMHNLIAVQPNIDKLIKKHYIDRMLTPNRFTDEVIDKVVSTKLKLNRSISIG